MPKTTRHGITFDRVVNATEDLGMAPDGSEPIDNKLLSGLQNGTLIEFPPGEYRIAGNHGSNGLERWGIRGLGDSPEDVTFTPAEGEHVYWLEVKNSDEILWENFAFNTREDWVTSIHNVMRVEEYGRIQDVHYIGWLGNEAAHVPHHSRLNCYAESETGEIVMDGFEKLGREWVTEYPDSSIMLFSGPGHNGTLSIKNSKFANCGEHAIYASRCPGGVQIDGCYFENNQNTHVRVSGSNSWVKNSTFVWDPDHDNKGYPLTGPGQAATGLVWESGFQGFSGGLVENCDFICPTDWTNGGCIQVDGSHGSVTIRDCRLKVDGDGAEPIWVDAPGDSHMIDGEPEKPWDVTIENVHITGTGEPQGGKDAAIEVRDRPGSTLTGLCIETPNRDGVRLTGGQYPEVSGSMTVGGRDVVTESASVTTVSVAPDADCAVPNDPTDGDGGTDSEDDTDGTADTNGEDDTNDTNGSETPMRTITITGGGSDVRTTYQFSVSGTAEPNPNLGSFDAEDTIDGGTVSGVVLSGGIDSYLFDGEITAYTHDGQATVAVDGTEVDPDSLGSSDSEDDSDDGGGEDGTALSEATVEDILAELEARGWVVGEGQYVHG